MFPEPVAVLPTLKDTLTARFVVKFDIGHG